MMFSTVLDILWTYRQGFLNGLVVTLQMAAIIWGVGILGGAALGWLGAQHRMAIGLPSRAFSFLLSGVPILVFLFWLHYPLQAMLDVVVDPFITATLTFTIVNVFAVSDLVRGAINDFPRQYRISARVCGLTPSQIAFRIELPLLLREILPGLMMLQVAMLHTTLFASLISVEEIFRVAQRINASIYKPVEIYTALGMFFLAICLPINGIALWLKGRFTRDISEQ
ncbi:MAG: ABC transporter permease subunit [Alphaproteobacteria bacterium]|nr:MAG: ABC transporter permease subunit [Alphaproteobacteria bacterium]